MALVALAASGCRRGAPERAVVGARADAAVAHGPQGAWSPQTLAFDDYVGAAACGECHREAYEAWKASPHGRAMARPTPQTVLGDFAAREVTLPGGVVQLTHEGDGYFMTLGGARHAVELVLASGRQHQLYVTRGASGTLQLLPLYWSTRTREWVLTSLLMNTSLDPASRFYWQKSEIASDGNCFYCHLSQGRSRADGARVEQQWVDLSINCEACHGAGRKHVAAARAHRVEPYSDLRLLSNVEEGLVCARCHATQHTFNDPGRRDIEYTALGSGLYRPDATQYGTSYQWAAHVTSGCYLRGAATCSGCHDPHRQNARDITGASAAGEASNRQCTDCHRALVDERAAARHGHHAPSVKCVDCHMPEHWIKDSKEARQRVCDHSISVPRPRESLELHTPNACGECHEDKDAEWALAALAKWGAKRALGVRPWVRAVALGRKQAPGAKEALVEQLGAKALVPLAPLVLGSLLDMLADLPPDEALAPVIAPWVESTDANIRAFALRAMWTHDLARRESWMQNAAADEHPYVRLILLAEPKPVPLGAAQIRRFVDDIVRYSTTVPGLPLGEVGIDRARLGQYALALEIVERALGLATPLQIERMRLGEARERLRRELPGGAAAPR